LQTIACHDRIKTTILRVSKLTLLLVTALIFFGFGAAIFLFITTFFTKPKPPEFKPSKISNFKGPTPLPTYYKTITSEIDTSAWEIYTDEKLAFSVKHPKDIIVDGRQTVKGKRTAFVFQEDQEKPLPNNVPTLFVVDTGNKDYDGLTVYKYADCKQPCTAETQTANWVALNESAYGIKNPNKTDAVNYFLTDKNTSGSVVNMYVGNVKDIKAKEMQEKIKTLEAIITTIEFKR
jgi:hypothetical protein